LGAVPAEAPKVSLGAIRSALAKKGYKTEKEQLKVMLWETWPELTSQDFKNALSWISDLKEKTSTKGG